MLENLRRRSDSPWSRQLLKTEVAKGEDEYGPHIMNDDGYHQAFISCSKIYSYQLFSPLGPDISLLEKKQNMLGFHQNSVQWLKFSQLKFFNEARTLG